MASFPLLKSGMKSFKCEGIWDTETRWVKQEGRFRDSLTTMSITEQKPVGQWGTFGFSDIKLLWKDSAACLV